LAGNPSDGYGGATLSLAIANFRARVAVGEADGLEIRSGPYGVASFASFGALVAEARSGYGDAPRLLRATLVRFWDLARSRGRDLSEAKFAIEYETTIPAEVGLGGSSAIVVAAMLALCERFAIDVQRDELPALALSVETEELGVAAGLQDRVAQTLGGLTYMDFDPAHSGRRYEPLRPRALPPLLLVAWDPDAGAASGLVHAGLRRRFEAGEPGVLRAMAELAEQAALAREAILAGDAEALGRSMDASFEARRSIVGLDPRHVRLINLARARGCAANYTGSGGAISVLCRDESHASEVQRAFVAAGFGCERCRPAPAAHIANAGR
jgi:glucuronokinase